MARLWAVVAALCVGATAGPAVSPRVAAVSAACGLVAMRLRRRPVVALLGLCLVCAAAGSVVAASRARAGDALTSMARAVPRCAFDVRVLERSSLGTLADVASLRCGDDVIFDPGVVYLEDEEAEAGARIVGQGWLVPLGTDLFATSRRRHGAGALLQVTTADVQEVRGGPFAVAAAVRRGLDTATEPLDPRRAALLEGLALGDTDELDPQTLSSFRASGLAHLVAVSGTNVAIVLGCLLLLGARLALRTRLAAAAVALGLYVLTVGPDASVLRAAAMGAVGLLALAAGRRVDPLRALGLALCLLVALRPALVFSVGLHLSVAATAGIVLWAGPLARRLRRIPRAVRLPLAVTLAAQVAVAPILVAVFGEVSVTGPVANVLAAPAVAPATIVALCSAVAGAAIPALGGVLARLADPFAGWILWLADAFGTPSWAAAEIPVWIGWIAALPLVGAAVDGLVRAERSLG